MKSNRILLVFSIIIAAVLIATVIVVLVNQNKDVSLLPENTPAGTVQRFLLAVRENDLQKAYTYLDIVEKGNRLTYEEWIGTARPPVVYPQRSWRATLGKANITGNTATIEVQVDIFRSDGQPLDNSMYTITLSYELTQFNNSWLITSRPDLFWLY